MKLLGSTILVSSFLFVGCGSAPPAPAPVPVASSPPPPALPPTLSVQVSYGTGLTLRLRLDGTPVEGAVVIAPSDRADAVSPGEPAEAPFGATSLTARAGDVVVDAAVLPALASGNAFDLYVGGRRYPLPQPTGTNPVRCMQAVRALGELDACRHTVPAQAQAPTICDDAGRSAWLEAREGREAATDACWRSLDPAVTESVAAIRDSALSQRACTRLKEVAGPDVSGDAGHRLFAACERYLGEPLRSRLLLAKRTADLPAAFERAKIGSNAEMQSFFRDYRLTQDPRVEEIRKLAITRFGPPKPDQYRAAMRAIGALTKESWNAKLCDVRDGVATVAIFAGGGRPRFLSSWEEPPLQLDAAEGGDDDARLASSGGAGGEAESPGSCTLMRMVMPRRRHPPEFEKTVIAVTKMRTGAREVRVQMACITPHWYFDESR